MTKKQRTLNQRRQIRRQSTPFVFNTINPWNDAYSNYGKIHPPRIHSINFWKTYLIPVAFNGINPLWNYGIIDPPKIDFSCSGNFSNRKCKKGHNKWLGMQKNQQHIHKFHSNIPFAFNSINQSDKSDGFQFSIRQKFKKWDANTQLYIQYINNHQYVLS